MTYLTEFSADEHPPQEVIDWLKANGFEDQSWHNDVLPHWEKGLICVWATSAENAKHIGYQFGISMLIEDEELGPQHDACGEGLEFNEWEEACRTAIEAMLAKGAKS